MGTLWSIAAVLALRCSAVVALVGIWLVRRPQDAGAAADRMGADRAAGVLDRRAPRLQAAARGAAAPHRAVEAAAGALLPAERSRRSALLVRPARRDQRDLRVCSANGRVLAAIDLDTDRGNSRRILQIKQSVLGACRVRYLRCPVDNLPTVAELQLLVPSSTARPRAARSRGIVPPRDSARRARLAVEHRRDRRAERTALWQDSTLFQDSFFAPDSRARRLRQQRIRSRCTCAKPRVPASRLQRPRRRRRDACRPSRRRRARPASSSTRRQPLAARSRH